MCVCCKFHMKFISQRFVIFLQKITFNSRKATSTLFVIICNHLLYEINFPLDGQTRQAKIC